MKEKHIGGQAVIEGVMMRSEKRLAVAVRLNNGKVKVKLQRLRKLKKPFRLPFIRGIFSLIEMLVMGIKTLTWSAQQQLGKEEKLSAFELLLTVLLSFGFAILFFIIAPFFLTKIFFDKGVLFNLVDGVFRIAIFLIYIAAVSSMKDVRRIFQYHGAEHKVVNCYEANKALTVKNIKKFSTLHPRCGTAFILIVLVLSILVFSLVKGSWQIRLISRILLIPVIAGISYEILKLSAKYKNNALMKAIIYPGLLLQKITTRQPNKRMIEVAVAALKKAR